MSEHPVCDVYNNNSPFDEYTIKQKQRLAMLDTLLWAKYDGQQSDDRGIQEEVDTFVFAGYDTTMTALTFILCMIANHQNVQENMYAEILEHHLYEQEQRADIQQYSKLNLMDRVIKESLRLYPPAHVIGRVLGEDTMLGKTASSYRIKFY